MIHNVVHIYCNNILPNFNTFSFCVYLSAPLEKLKPGFSHKLAVAQQPEALSYPMMNIIGILNVLGRKERITLQKMPFQEKKIFLKQEKIHRKYRSQIQSSLLKNLLERVMTTKLVLAIGVLIFPVFIQGSLSKLEARPLRQQGH